MSDIGIPQNSIKANSIVIGGPNETTLTATSASSDIVLTIPDAGADSDVVLCTTNPLIITNVPSAGQKLIKTTTTAAQWVSLTGNPGNGQLGPSIGAAYWQQGGSGKAIYQLPLLLNGSFAGKYFMLH